MTHGNSVRNHGVWKRFLSREDIDSLSGWRLLSTAELAGKLGLSPSVTRQRRNWVAEIVDQQEQ